MTVNIQEWNTWRSGVRYALCAASQLSGGGPLMWVMSLNLHANLKPDDDDDDNDDDDNDEKLF